jgi:hypothetical protein
VEEFAGCSQDPRFGVRCDSHGLSIIDRSVKSTFVKLFFLRFQRLNRFWLFVFDFICLIKQEKQVKKRTSNDVLSKQ